MREPGELICVGVGLAIIGGLLIGTGVDAAWLPGIAFLISGMIWTAGMLGQGVVVGSRTTLDDADLRRLVGIDEADEDWRDG